MLDASRASRLLRTAWSSPSDLAFELYSMVMSKEPKTLEAPLTIRVPNGTTALKIVQSAPTQTVQTNQSASGIARRAATQAPEPQPRRPGDQPTEPPKVRLNEAPKATDKLTVAFSGPSRTVRPATQVSPAARPKVYQTEYPSEVRLDFDPIPTPFRIEDIERMSSGPEIERHVVRTEGEILPPRPPEPLFTPQEIASLDTPIEGGPARSEVAFLLPTPEGRDSIQPYRSPIIDVTGEVAFKGPPVQFDQPPRVFNPKTKTYDSITDYPFEKLTHIPEARLSFDNLFGKVKSSSGTTWTVTIYPDGKPPTSGVGSNPTNTYDATVTVLNTPTAYKPVVGAWVGPILDFSSLLGADDPDFYYFVSAPDGKYAYVSGSISAASSNTLGLGTITLCSRSGATLTNDGATATCYNAGGAITGPKYIAVHIVDGDWSTMVAPC